MAIRIENQYEGPLPKGTLQQIEDALAVCAAFNITDRLADAFSFQLLDRKGYDAGAKYLLKRGYA